MNMERMSTELENQQHYLEEKGEQNFTFVAPETFVEGMRDSGYKSTATAIDEFVDNSIQAGATRVNIISTETTRGKKRKRRHVKDIAIIDNGHGMLPGMMCAAVTWGGTHRHNDRDGLGRYGFGLPSAAVSITRDYDVYSRVAGGKWHKISINLDEIAKGKFTDKHGAIRTPEAIAADLPDFVKNMVKNRPFAHGTIVILNNVDRPSPGFVTPGSFDSKLIEHLGLVYRGLLSDCQIFVNEKKVEIIDPLFLNPAGHFHETKAKAPKAQERNKLEFQFATEDGKRIGTIRIRFSYLPFGFQGTDLERKKDEELDGRFKVMKENNAFFIVTRAGRQVDLVGKTQFGKPEFTLVNNDRNWTIELDFDPTLDEEFGITVNKQQVTLSERVWDKLKEEGVPGIIKNLRKNFKKDKGRRIPNKPKNSVLKDSEIVMKHADQHETGTNHLGAYKVLTESLPGAPFYRTEYNGAQLQLFINTDHLFFSDLYQIQDLGSRTQTGLELLLFALGYCENQSSEELEEFYKRERQEWSKRLETYLHYLNGINPLETDEDTAHSTELQTVEVN
ncbi:MAG: ATP-binding protein [Candidatus Poribacteria bacterium]|nr:ATP-binding protein [Candidatus Poribacteria bacterium]